MLHIRVTTCYLFFAMSFTLGIHTAVGGSLYLHFHRIFCSPASGHRWKTPAWCVRRSVPSVTMTFLFQAVLRNTRGCVKILRRFQEGCQKTAVRFGVLCIWGGGRFRNLKGLSRGSRGSRGRSLKVRGGLQDFARGSEVLEGPAVFGKSLHGR